MRVAGTHVLLTGATGDIGRRLARRFSDAGATLTLVARGRAELAALAADVGGIAAPADLTDRDDLRALVREVERAHRPVDVLVNNAGTETAGHLTDLTSADLEQLVALNLLAPA